MRHFNEQEFKERLSVLIKTHFTDDKEFAKALGVSPATANRWRNQKLIPKIDLLAKLARLIETSLDYIILGES